MPTSAQGVLKRVVEFEDFSTCWPNDQLKAKGLVGEVRRVINVKDSFTRINKEREAERGQRLREAEEQRQLKARRRAQLEEAKADLYALFALEDKPQERGILLEKAINGLFSALGYLSMTISKEDHEMSVENFDSMRTINRRVFLKTVILGGAALAAGPLAWTKSVRAQNAIVLPEMPYAKDALEPAVSGQTINFHYAKHHAGYVQNTNNLLQGSGLEELDLETIILKASRDDDLRDLFNNAAQVWNHTFYWHSMRPGGGRLPDGPLKKKIEADYGSLKNLKASLSEKASSQFASGWAWLVLKNGHLSCINTANAHTPIAMGMTPLLCIDVWEHAYYLDYQNRRGDYVQNFLEHLVNWDFANENLKEALY